MSDLRAYVVACPSCNAVPVTIDDEAGSWRCACGNGGDLFDYVMQDRNLTFSQALRELGRDAGVDAG